MAGQLRNNIRLALRTVRGSKWRSLLTLTGIVIGVASFIVVVAIGQGIKNQVSGQVDQLGKDLITVKAGRVSTAANPLGFTSSISSSGALNASDLTTINKVNGVDLAVPLGLVASTPKLNNHEYTAGPVVATNEKLPDIIKRKLAYGAFFNDSDSINSAVVGANVAKSFFGQDVPLGEDFELLGHRFVVTGVFEQFDAAPFSLNTNFNDTIFVPLDAARQLTNSHMSLYEILVKPTSSKHINKVASDIDGKLEASHGQHDFTVLTQAQSMAATDNILSLITKMIVGVAAVALLVGGVGIMDVMLVSVTERMGEIGLRKAVGASNQQILKQFVVEALVLSAIGALVGTLLSLLVAYLIFLFTDLQPSISWVSVLIADMVALAVGVIFGTIPALKAARKNPIEALRNE